MKQQTIVLLALIMAVILSYLVTSLGLNLIDVLLPLGMAGGYILYKLSCWKNRYVPKEDIFRQHRIQMDKLTEAHYKRREEHRRKRIIEGTWDPYEDED